MPNKKTELGKTLPYQPGITQDTTAYMTLFQGRHGKYDPRLNTRVVGIISVTCLPSKKTSLFSSRKCRYCHKYNTFIDFRYPQISVVFADFHFKLLKADFPFYPKVF